MGGKGRECSMPVHHMYNASNKGYSSSCKSSLGGDQSSCGGLSFETHTGRIDSTRRRSFEALPVRKPLSVDDAMPYVLRALPALVETVLQLRALRTLLALLIAVGMAGTGKARREDEGLEEPYSGGKIWARAVWGRRSGSLFIRLALADSFRLTAGFVLGVRSGLSTVT